ncbi:hypothetical protein BC629DRAFT_1540649 [Irpex lacteus]|nr:hypothetical protein BC629DRAFT_1540649 [Irpex lacteus]
MSNCRCIVFAAVRTYAIWDKDRRIFVGVVYYCTQTAYFASSPPFIGCQYRSTLPDHINIHFSADTLYQYSALLLTYDGLVAVGSSIMTVPAVYQLRRLDSTSAPSLASALISRFILDLRTEHLTPHHDISDSYLLYASEFSSVRFELRLPEHVIAGTRAQLEVRESADTQTRIVDA